MVLLFMFIYPKCCWMASWSLELVFIVHNTCRFHQCPFDHPVPGLQDAYRSHRRQSARKIMLLAHLNLTTDIGFPKGVQVPFSNFRGQRLRGRHPALKWCILSDENFSSLFVWWVGQIDIIFALHPHDPYTLREAVRFNFKFMDNKDPIVLHSQRHGCWCSGGVNNQGISEHGIRMGVLKSVITNHGSRQLSVKRKFGALNNDSDWKGAGFGITSTKTMDGMF